MIKIDKKSKCSGCQACVHSCPMQCISVKPDNEGFLYPEVDGEKCINCGLCNKVCPFQNPFEERNIDEVFASFSKNDEVRLSSSSGGVFSILAEKIFSENGVVFGARFDDNWQVVIDCAEKKDELRLFKGSKYVQSSTEDSFKKCEKFLKAGRKVLFSGTPCQIAGLNHFLKKEYENLWTCEVVCHGSPSPKVWKRYLDEIGVARECIKQISFRSKEKGWDDFCFHIAYDAGGRKCKSYEDHRKNPYMKAFLSDLILRPSCYNCMAKNGRSHSDLALADFWGISKLNPDFDDDKGVSMLVVYTQHGKDLVDWGRLQSYGVLPDVAVPMCRGMKGEIKENCKRYDFFRQLDDCNNVANLMNKFTRESVWNQMKDFLRPVKFFLLGKGGK